MSSARYITMLVWLALLASGCAQRTRPEIERPFFPPLPEIPRIQYLTSITSEEDIGLERDSFREFVTGKAQPVRVIARPWDIDHHGDKLYIVDKAYHRVLIVDLAAKRFDSVGTEMTGQLTGPDGIFVDASGYKYVADRGRRTIFEFDPLDRYSRSFTDGDRFAPVDVVVDGNLLYACDVEQHEVRVYDRTSGQYIRSITGSDAPGGRFHTPTHLTIDDDGHLYVTDFLNFRVQRFDRDGNFVTTIGELGDFAGSMPRPKGIATDRENHLYAVDSAFEVIQVFDATSAEPLLPFGKFGSFGGTWLPAGIHIDYDNVAHFARYADPRLHLRYLIYVANQTGPFKINVYGYGVWVPDDTGIPTH